VADLDARLAASVERWVDAHREGLLARGVMLRLDGPNQPNGTMDPVYLLRLDGIRAEAEAVLFEGGMLLLATFDKERQATRETHLDAVAEEQVTDALTLLADGL
jgi:hypothetical protein